MAKGFSGDESEELIKYVKGLEAAIKKAVDWLDRLADSAQKCAEGTRFVTMKEAYESDAKNYRATANDMRKSLSP